MSSEEQLRYSRLLEAFGGLSAEVAHDINNLLSGVLGYSELLLSEPAIDHLKPYIEEISSAGRRIASLVRILMVFNRKYTCHPEILDLNNTIREIERFIIKIIGSGIEFDIETAAELWPVSVDSAQIKQALINLAIDMGDMLPEGGKLAFRTQNLIVSDTATQDHPPSAGRYILVTAEATANRIRSSLYRIVQNTESGQEAIFGIPIVYKIIRSCGGEVQMDTQAGQKVTLRIYLPPADAT